MFTAFLFILFVLLAVGLFLGGALFFRRRGPQIEARIESDAKAVSAVVQNVADTTKKL